MGMFDEVYCYYKLRPVRLTANNLISFAPGTRFQTKDLYNILDSYILSVDGKLLYKEFNWIDKVEPISANYKDMFFDGIFNFYTVYKNEENSYMIDFYARFKEGLVQHINHEVTSLIKKHI